MEIAALKAGVACLAPLDHLEVQEGEECLEALDNLAKMENQEDP